MIFIISPFLDITSSFLDYITLQENYTKYQVKNANGKSVSQNAYYTTEDVYSVDYVSTHFYRPTFIDTPAYPIDLATPKYDLTTRNTITPPPTLLQHPHPLFYLIKPPTPITPITHPYFTPSLHPLLNPITPAPQTNLGPQYSLTTRNTITRLRQDRVNLDLIVVGILSMLLYISLICSALPSPQSIPLPPVGAIDVSTPPPQLRRRRGSYLGVLTRIPDHPRLGETLEGRENIQQQRVQWQSIA